LRRIALSYVSLGVPVLVFPFMTWGLLAETSPLHVRQSFLAAETVVDGRIAQYVVRFDGWVDHGASRMDITENGKLVQVLVPTGDSEPDALTASAPSLAPGRYQLHWRARSNPHGDFSDGFIPFTVAH